MAVPHTTQSLSTSRETETVFSRSIVVSAIRCVITYVFIPFVAPLLGLAPGVGPRLGLVIGAIALVANFYSLYRLFSTRHRWRWPAFALHAAVIVLLVVLIVQDVNAL